MTSDAPTKNLDKADLAHAGWLSARPPEVCAAIAARAAIRILPLGVPSRLAPVGADADLLLTFIRSMSIALARSLCPEKFDTLRPCAYNAAAASYISAEAMCARWAAYRATDFRFLNMECDLRASEEALLSAGYLSHVGFEDNCAASVSKAINTMVNTISAIERRDVHTLGKGDVYATGERGFQRAREAAGRFRNAVSGDIKMIDAGCPPESLIRQPLWPDTHRSWRDWRKQGTVFPSSPDWRVWKKLLNKVNYGHGILGEEILIYATAPDEAWKSGVAATNDWIDQRLKSESGPEK